MDVHLDQPHDQRHASDMSVSSDTISHYYQATEAAAIVLHELVKQLLHLAVTCERLEIPQKWIGSSVALGYDGSLFPGRDQDSGQGGERAGEELIRSKVIVKLFDWGRSEVLTRRRFKAMTVAEQNDRQGFWNNYKSGVSSLAYNAARSFYHHFTNTGRWTQLTLKVMDFDSFTRDDYLGQAEFTLPDPSDTAAVKALEGSGRYQLIGNRGGATSGIIMCSIIWVAFPNESRLRGTWRVTIQRAEDLPAMDPNNLSDPYCILIARDFMNGNDNNSTASSPSRRELHQVTCVKPRSLNPGWNETFDVPIFKVEHASCLAQVLAAQNVIETDSSLTDQEMATLFSPSKSTEWRDLIHEAAQK